MMLSNPPAFIDFSIDNEVFQVPDIDVDSMDRLCLGDWFSKQDLCLDKINVPTTPVKQNENFLSKSLPQLVAELEVDELEFAFDPLLATGPTTKKRSVAVKRKKQDQKTPAKKKQKTQTKSVEKKSKPVTQSKSSTVKDKQVSKPPSTKTKKKKTNQGTLNKTKQKTKTKPKVQRLQTPKEQIVLVKQVQTVSPKGKAHRSKWADKDILTLWQGIHKHGSEWRVIRELFPGRTYDQIKDKGRRLLQQKRWKSGRTKALSDDASRGAKQIALTVLQSLQKVKA